MNPFRILAYVAALWLFWPPQWAEASTSVHVLAIGYNGAPTQVQVGAGELPLRYADDDAAAVYQYAGELGHDARLLTVMDADTQGRFPTEVTHARPPTLSELRAEVGRLREAINTDRLHGNDSSILIFYSGHGSRPSGGPAALTLLDGPLTRDFLYDEVLSALPATFIHLFIDACYAEAVVRPRDVDAAAVPLSPSDIAQYAARDTLARFPNVGAIVASSTSSQTHEWDTYRHGVFTHELLSGLRGGADVNGDDRIEYSELYAFLGAANRDVTDSRARLSVVVRAPGTNARIPIVELTHLKAAGRLAGISARVGQVYLEDELGNRLADVRVENGTSLALAVPADRRIYVRSRTGEAEVILRAEQTLAFENITLAPPAERVRGVLDLAMRRGLFKTGFGPNYYRGFIDQASGFVAVPLGERESAGVTADGAGSAAEQGTGPFSSRSEKASSQALYVAGGVAAGIGRNLGPMTALRFGLRSAGPTGFVASVDGALGSTTVFTERHLLASAGYRLGITAGRFTAFGAACVGGGVLDQTAVRAGQPDYEGNAWTGALLVRPMIGIAFQVSERFGIASEANVDVLLYRRDGSSNVTPVPSAHLGVAMGL